MDIPLAPEGGSPVGWLIMGAGAFIVWLAWRKKRGGAGAPMIFIPMPGPGRKRTNPLLIILLFVGLIAALFWGADWLTAHMPLAPGNRR